MDSIKVKLAMLYQSILSTVHDWKIVAVGQSVQYDILQTAHRLEKGLTIPSPRKMWGWDKADRLVRLIECCESSFEQKVGISVLNHYSEAKRTSRFSEDRIKYKNFFQKYVQLLNIAVDDYGGTVNLSIEPDDEEMQNVWDKIVRSRHSIRQFAITPVSQVALERAIDQALACPSACNRQPMHIYIVSKNAKERTIGTSDLIADKNLYITGDINAYGITEFNDWIVSPSIFVGYLSIALHVNGIGSCIMRKDLVVNTDYNRAVRRLCNIPNNEKLILEMAIGNYPDSVVVPVSKRKTPLDITSFID